MKSLFLLIDEAKQKYYSNNAEFQNKVDVMLSSCVVLVLYLTGVRN